MLAASAAMVSLIICAFLTRAVYVLFRRGMIRQLLFLSSLLTFLAVEAACVEWVRITRSCSYSVLFFLDDSSRRVCEPSKRQVTQMAIDIFCCGSSFEWIGRAEKECSTQPASRKRGTIVFDHRIRHVGYFVV